MSHTKGPWEYRPAPHCDIVTGYANPEPCSEDEQEPIRIIRTYGAMSGEDTTADAILMSTSPEMLDALELIYEHAKPQPFGEAYAPMDSSWVRELLEPIIAKAKGGRL